MNHNNKYFDEDQIKKDQSIKTHLKDRIARIGRKMTRGASNIFRSLRAHGNNIVSRLKGHHKPK